MSYLHSISTCFIKSLASLAELEILREKVQMKLSEENKLQLLENLPYIIGMEYVTNDWLIPQWSSLLEIFKSLIISVDTSVKEFFESMNSNIHVADRIYFHLVEQKNDERPFAFLATYAVEENGNA